MMVLPRVGPPARPGPGGRMALYLCEEGSPDVTAAANGLLGRERKAGSHQTPRQDVVLSVCQALE